MSGVYGARLPGDPGALEAAAGTFEAVAHGAADARQRLAALDSGAWTGAAAAAFRTKADHDVPPDLEKLSHSFDAAARSLRTYAGQLGDAQGQLRTLDRRREQVELQLSRDEQAANAAQQQHRQAQARLTAAQEPAQQSIAQQAVGNARQAVARARAAVDGSTGELRRLDRQAHQVCDVHEGQAKACAAALHAASDAGIKNSVWSWAEEHVVQPVKAHADIVIDATLEAVDEVFDWVATGCVVAAAISVFVFPAAAPVLLALGTAAGGLSLAANLLLYTRKNTSPLDRRTDDQRREDDRDLLVHALGMVPGVGKGGKVLAKGSKAMPALKQSAKRNVFLTSPGDLVERGVVQREWRAVDQVLRHSPGSRNPNWAIRPYFSKLRRERVGEAAGGVVDAVIDEGKDAVIDWASRPYLNFLDAAADRGASRSPSDAPAPGARHLTVAIA